VGTLLRRFFPLLLVTLPSACGGGGDALPLELEIKDGAATAGGKPDQLELVVKTLPGTEVRFEGQTKSTGEKSTESFTIPKSKLKLGKNSFTVDGTSGVLFSKKSGSKTVQYDLDTKSVVRFYPSAAADGDATASCEGTMCGGSAFKLSKAGHLPLEVESYVNGTVTVEGQRASVGGGKRATLDIDLAPKLAAASVGALDKLPLSVAFEADGGKGAETLTMSGPALADLVARKLAEIEKGPVPLPGEGAAPPEPQSMLVVGAPASKLIAVGKPGKLSEVDFVAVAKPSERFFGCSKANSLGIVYNDLEVKVYERRTGKTVGTRKLLADRVPCPPTQTANLTGNVREDDIKKVLAELLKK
jgi:hypothetical protein